MNWNTKNKKKFVYLRRENHKKIVKKRIILSAVVLMAVIASGFIVKAKFQEDQETIYTKAEVVEDSTNTNESGVEDESLDNSGYLPLEKDENSDDAFEVEKVMTKKQPVRTDGKKVVYLTFDDGPSTENTPRVLDILKENNIKATFMIMGKNAELSQESKEILKRTVKEGHAIGNHTYSHNTDKLYQGKLRTIDVNNFMADVDKCNQTLKSILGKDFSTRVIRFPGGFFPGSRSSLKGSENIEPILKEKGYASIDWNDETEDAEGKKKNADELVERGNKNLERLGPNADSVVILMHDTYGKGETVNSLQRVIDMFKEKGFEFRTIK